MTDAEILKALDGMASAMHAFWHKLPPKYRERVNEALSTVDDIDMPSVEWALNLVANDLEDEIEPRKSVDPNAGCRSHSENV